MNKIEIRVVDTINSPSALTREQGKLVYDTILTYMKKNQKVILDFSDIESLITPFLNVAIGKLYEDYSSDQIKELIEFTHIPTGMTSKFQLVINNAKLYYSNKDGFNDVLKDVLNG